MAENMEYQGIDLATRKAVELEYQALSEAAEHAKQTAHEAMKLEAKDIEYAVSLDIAQQTKELEYVAVLKATQSTKQFVQELQEKLEEDLTRLRDADDSRSRAHDMRDAELNELIDEVTGRRPSSTVRSDAPTPQPAGFTSLLDRDSVVGSHAPRFAHAPVLTDSEAEASKSTGARPNAALSSWQTRMQGLVQQRREQLASAKAPPPAAPRIVRPLTVLSAKRLDSATAQEADLLQDLGDVEPRLSK